MKIDTDLELWKGDIGPQKYRLIITVEAIRDYGTDKEMIVKNEITKRQLLERWIQNEHIKINEKLLNFNQKNPSQLRRGNING